MCGWVDGCAWVGYGSNWVFYAQSTQLYQGELGWLWGAEFVSFSEKSTVVVQGMLRFSRSKHIKRSKERLFITTQTYNLQFLGAIPFVKRQNDT